ncbi:hypothetical protein B0H19DRAFT_1083429 [Mycena capillaripes]|nr:hypothetical protein B0H19DRAFT_1083429 [Mycena capillaripes]
MTKKIFPTCEESYKIDSHEKVVLPSTNVQDTSLESHLNTNTDGTDVAELTPYPLDFTIHYVVTESEANTALLGITDGVVGFDTEYVPRKLSAPEAFIEEIFKNVPGNKRSQIIVWQMLQAEYGGGFNILWNNIGLCIISVSFG